MNLSRPLEITNEKISVGFFKEQFVKQAKEQSKKTPLENAAKNYLGVNNILIDVKLIDENYVLEKKNDTIIIKDIEKSSEKNMPSVENNDDNSENEYYEKMLNERKEIVPNYSDNARMVQELFNGKYID